MTQHECLNCNHVEVHETVQEQCPNCNFLCYYTKSVMYLYMIDELDEEINNG